MRSNHIFGLNCLVLVITMASCTYQPWEDIKKWYNDEGIEYDSEGAEDRHLKLEQNCSDAVGATDGLCFDECMFRTQYEFTILEHSMDSTEKNMLPYTYSIVVEMGVMKLEEEIFQLTQTSDMHIVFRQRVSSCKNTFQVDPETDEKLKNNYVEAGKHLCTLTFNVREIEEMASIVNCLKEQLKKI